MFEPDQDIVDALKDGSFADKIASGDIHFESALYDTSEIFKGDAKAYCAAWADAYPANQHSYEMEKALKSFIEDLPETEQPAAVAVAATFFKTLYTTGKIPLDDMASLVSADIFKSDTVAAVKKDYADYAKSEVFKEAKAAFENPQKDEPFDAASFARALMSVRTKQDREKLQKAESERRSKTHFGKRKNILEALYTTMSNIDGIDNDAAVTAYGHFAKALEIGDLRIDTFNHYINSAFTAMDDTNKEKLGLACVASIKAHKARAGITSEYLHVLRHMGATKMPASVMTAAADEMLETLHDDFKSAKFISDDHRTAPKLIASLPVDKRDTWLNRFQTVLMERSADKTLVSTSVLSFATALATAAQGDTRAALIKPHIEAVLDDNREEGEARWQSVANFLESAAKGLASITDKALHDKFAAKLLDAYKADDIEELGTYVKLAITAATKLPSQVKFTVYKDLIDTVETLGREKDVPFIDIQKARLDLALKAYALADKASAKANGKGGLTAEDAKKWALGIALACAADLGQDIDSKLRGRLHQLFMAQAEPALKSNHLIVWKGMNKRGKPAVAYLATGGEAIVDIFNMRGTVTDVKAQIESRYPKGHARRGIFDSFVGNFGLMPR